MSTETDTAVRIPLGRLADCGNDEFRTLVLAGKRILLFRDRGGDLVAVEDLCRKRGMPLTRKEEDIKDTHHPACGCAVVQHLSEWAQARQCRCATRHPVVMEAGQCHLLLRGG
ncbi:hypothetical protein J2T57_004037 [Natronocella acetinitrilica]|uniref:Rieske domain-containing protein n=1 Tax=Natronocella acetinitrilica TaxID=414046 RepID=A0AAE3KDH7_9GAMM|nr:Rieske 2Fe-2S domain-containing protein [Natronocella acetinitrilica]MCP1676864.1 hypothetical protein [Natronocella acetinitrilica]